MHDSNGSESLEGWWILHRMFAFNRREWDALPEKRRIKYAGHAGDLVDHLKASDDGDVGLTQIVGHKGDLMLTHYACTFDGLAYAQTLVDKLELRAFLEPCASYVSVLELGPFEATTMRAKIPARRYQCFYPMSRRLGEAQNFVARSYQGRVTQVISGSIGFDAFEWGVDLYADDPLVFKKVVAEMRLGEANAGAGFGSFWTGLQFSSGDFAAFLDGDAIPQFDAISS